MNLAENYVYEIYKENSFSKAAKKLYISQSSLSLTIKKLEKNLGFIIFDRSSSPISLTREGKIYIEYLEEAMNQEINMFKRITTLSKSSGETLSVGNAFFLSRLLLPDACRKFNSIYPDVELKLNMGETALFSDLLEMLDAEKINLLIGYAYDEKKYIGIPLLEERYIICIRNDYKGTERLMPYAHTYDEIISGRRFPEKVISDFSLFRNIEFLKIDSTAIIWRDMANFLMHCPISPCSVYKCRNIDVIYDLMLCGMGAAITTDSVISYRPPTEDVLYFIVDTPKATCQSHIIYKKDFVLSESTTHFIELLRAEANKITDHSINL